MRSLTKKEMEKIFEALYCGEDSFDITSLNFNSDSNDGSVFDKYSLYTDFVWCQFYALMEAIKSTNPVNLEPNELMVSKYF